MERIPADVYFERVAERLFLPVIQGSLPDIPDLRDLHSDECHYDQTVRLEAIFSNGAHHFIALTRHDLAEVDYQLGRYSMPTPRELDRFLRERFYRLADGELTEWEHQQARRRVEELGQTIGAPPEVIWAAQRRAVEAHERQRERRRQGGWRPGMPYARAIENAHALGALIARAEMAMNPPVFLNEAGPNIGPPGIAQAILDMQAFGTGMIRHEMTATEVRMRAVQAEQMLAATWHQEFAGMRWDLLPEIMAGHSEMTLDRMQSGAALLRKVTARIAPGQRAHELLMDSITPKQRQQMEEFNGFEVTGSKGGRYRIYYGTQINIVRQDAKGDYAGRICFLPTGNLQPGDVMLAQKIMLENDEPGALAIANRF